MIKSVSIPSCWGGKFWYFTDMGNVNKFEVKNEFSLCYCALCQLRGKLLHSYELLTSPIYVKTL